MAQVVHRNKKRLCGARLNHNFQGGLGNQTERAIGADKGLGKIIARDVFDDGPTGADKTAIGEGHGCTEHEIANSPVAHAPGSIDIAGDQAANGSSGPGGNERNLFAILCEKVLNLAIRSPCTNGDIEVIGSIGVDAAERAGIDTNAI